MRLMTARLWVASALCASFAAGALAAAGQSPNEPVTGTEIFNEFSWDRASGMSIDAQHIAFGDAPFHITLSVTYRGLKLAGAPELVDILLVRDKPAAEDLKPAGDQTPLVVAIVDKLPVPLTKQTADGPDRIKGVLSFEVFQWLVGGQTLDFEAFGHRFVLVPNQMATLKQAATDWAHAAKR
jgi:hypothetical protein